MPPASTWLAENDGLEGQLRHQCSTGVARVGAEMRGLEGQLCHWYNFLWLCGSSLDEQAVHYMDRILWAM
ncbi:MAG: hypothetical protein AAB676_06050 [Verrucomicrobiota bacterium]